MLSPSELAYVLQDSGARCAIVGADQWPSVDAVRSRVPALRPMLLAGPIDGPVAGPIGEVPTGAVGEFTTDAPLKPVIIQKMEIITPGAATVQTPTVTPVATPPHDTILSPK